MIDHMNLPVTDVERSRAFYDVVLDCLNYRCIAVDGDAIGYGGDSWQFGIEPAAENTVRLHIAFRAATKAQVDEFYSTAIGNGGRSNGEPGYRPRYGSGYYAAFVLDPDDHNVEAVFRESDS